MISNLLAEPTLLPLIIAILFLYHKLKPTNITNHEDFRPARDPRQNARVPHHRETGSRPHRRNLPHPRDFCAGDACLVMGVPLQRSHHGLPQLRPVFVRVRGHPRRQQAHGVLEVPRAHSRGVQEDPEEEEEPGARCGLGGVPQKIGKARV